MKKTDTEQKILSAMLSRDQRALGMIAENYEPLMRRVAYNLGLSREDTEECLNDVLLEAWNTIPPARPMSIRAYMCVLMRRIVIDKIRYNSAEKRRNTVSIEVAGEIAEIIDLENDVVDGICIPKILNEFLAGLSPENREIFIRRYFEFESTKSIAKDMCVRANTVEARLTRMKNKLKMLMRGWGYNND